MKGQFAKQLSGVAIAVFFLALPIQSAGLPKLKQYVNQEYKVSFSLLADGQSNFLIGAVNSSSLDYLVKSEVDHKLKPFGKSPKVTRRKLNGLKVVIIVSSEDADNANSYSSLIMVQLLNPLTLQHQGRTTDYNFLVIYTDKNQIRTITSTLQILR